jgi:hypothetical protein
MTEAEIKSLAEAIGSMLISNAAHGLATSSIQGLGEITLRDALVVAAAAAGARARQAWIIDREVVPNGWTDAPVDLMISRVGNAGNISLVGGTELKWWRRADPANAGNRRRDLVKDILRGAALYPNASAFSFVALLATEESWGATTDTGGSDRTAMALLKHQSSQSWNVTNLIESAALKSAVRQLQGRVPICNIFRTELLCSSRFSINQGRVLRAKVWRIKKPQNTVFLTDDRIEQLLQ